MNFRLAPMDGLIWLLTIGMAPLPLVLLVLSRGGVLAMAALFVALIYVYILLWLRPLRFELGPGALTVVWPLRRTEIALESIEEVLSLPDNRALKADLGWAIRIGAGGPWGGFGLLKTERRGMMRFYISRVSNYVLLRPKSGRAWLITPAEHERFLRTLETRGLTVRSGAANAARR